MIIFIFEDEEEARKAGGLHWQYMARLEKTPYEEITDYLDTKK